MTGATSASACIVCSDNTYAGDGSAICEMCPAGKISSAGSSSATDCRCEVGCCVQTQKYCSNYEQSWQPPAASWEDCRDICEAIAGCNGGYFWTGGGGVCYLFSPGLSADAACASPLLDDPNVFHFECAIPDSVDYTVAHTPPLYPKPADQQAEVAFINVKTDLGVVPGPQSGAYWNAPDRQGTLYEGGGDPSFYFVLDLGAIITVAKLRIRNCNAAVSCDLYSVRDYSISVSNAPTSGFGVEVTGTLQAQQDTIQDVPVLLTGRFLKFVCETYGSYSAALEYVEVVAE